MPPLLSVSPLIIDQSFPRDLQELRRAAGSLGGIARCASSGDAVLVMTKALEEFVGCFDWTRGGQYHALLAEIYRLLTEWLLQPHENHVRLDLAQVGDAPVHPTPEGAAQGVLVQLWAEELGRLLAAHDGCLPDDKGFFVGVACDSAFTGGLTGSYPLTAGRHFPMIGPQNLARLIDAYEWELEHDLHRRRVSFAAARRNCHVIGAVDVEEPEGDSHYKVVFRNARSWTLDRNVDPVPARFLKELTPITGYPYPVVKSALLNGVLPSRTLRLSSYLV